jgi:uncharacterized protein YgfB (UPF0149 family)
MSNFQIPSFEEFTSRFSGLNADSSVAEVHGVITGLLAGGARIHRANLQKIITTHADLAQTLPDSFAEDFWQLHLQTLEQLGDSELAFLPFLPEDDEDLSQRVNGLAEWCQGFLVGFGTAVKPNDARLHNPELQETLQDIVNISHVDAAAQDNDDADEGAYAELYEFVRMAVIHLFEELAPPAEPNAEGEVGTTTVH